MYLFVLLYIQLIKKLRVGSGIKPSISVVIRVEQLFRLNAMSLLEACVLSNSLVIALSFSFNSDSQKRVTPYEITSFCSVYVVIKDPV